MIEKLVVTSTSSNGLLSLEMEARAKINELIEASNRQEEAIRYLAGQANPIGDTSGWLSPVQRGVDDTLQGKV